MAVAQSILERVYVQLESTEDTIPNSGGVATVAGGDYMRHTKCTIRPIQESIESTDKTGSISATRGVAGARGAEWSLDFEARPSGAAGTAPDCDPLLVAAFGQNATVTPGVSVTYALASAIKSVSLWRFRQPASVMQQVVAGAVVRELQFRFEQNANCRFVMSGTGKWVVDSKNFSSLDTSGKCGLTAFPSEPASPTFAGTPVNGLAGSATIDGDTTLQIRSANIRLATAIEKPRDRLFAGQYPSAAERDILGVFLDLSIFDEDTAAVTNLYTKALARTTMDISLVAGTAAGARIRFNLNDCLLPMPELDDSPRKWAANLSGIRAYSSTLTSLDEFSLVFD